MSAIVVKCSPLSSITLKGNNNKGIIVKGNRIDLNNHMSILINVNKISGDEKKLQYWYEKNMENVKYFNYVEIAIIQDDF